MTAVANGTSVSTPGEVTLLRSDHQKDFRRYQQEATAAGAKPAPTPPAQGGVAPGAARRGPGAAAADPFSPSSRATAAAPGAAKAGPAPAKGPGGGEYEQQDAARRQLLMYQANPWKGGDSPTSEEQGIRNNPAFREMQQSDPAQAGRILEHAKWLRGIQRPGDVHEQAWDRYADASQNQPPETAGAKPAGGDVSPVPDTDKPAPEAPRLKQDLSDPSGSHFTDPAMAAAARRRAETMPYVPLSTPRRPPTAGAAKPMPAQPSQPARPAQPAQPAQPAPGAQPVVQIPPAARPATTPLPAPG
jgi:hypothetical protein